MFQRFGGEAIYSSSHGQIIDSSRQKSCENCENWARSDPECNIYTYNKLDQKCTKFKISKRRGHMLTIVTDPIPQTGENGLLTGKFYRPIGLSSHDSDFRFSAQHHQEKFNERNVESCANCRQKAIDTPGTRFTLYNERSKQ